MVKLYGSAIVYIAADETALVIINLYAQGPFTQHTYMQMVQVNGNLKVRLPPSKKFGQRDVELVEPSVMGFVGECRLIESASSIIELSISIPHSTFTMTRSLDMKTISVEST